MNPLLIGFIFGVTCTLAPIALIAYMRYMDRLDDDDDCGCG